MPYIKSEDKQKFNNLGHNNGCQFSVEHLGNMIENAGELNYIFTCIAHGYLEHKGLKYQHLNDIIGALEGCKLELYRRIAGPYEDIKIKENGDVLPSSLENKGY